MYSVGKKKGNKLSEVDKNITLKPNHSRNRSKTDNSPSVKNSLSKDQIKNAIKKIVCHENARESRLSQSKEEYRRNSKIGSRIEISIPGRSSLTPKGIYCSLSKPECRDRLVQSTKASDNSRMFTKSGRYGIFDKIETDLKQVLDNKNSKTKEVVCNSEEGSYSGNKIGRQNSRLEDTKIDENTVKIRHQDEFDVRSVLTTEEFEKFADRFPHQFKRVALLGRGGFSVVWLGIHRTTKRKVAIKQILTKNPHETHLKEIWFASYFFEKGGEAREEFENHLGINNICKLFSHEIKTIDSWLYYEVCEESLGSCLFDLQAETFEGEKSYKVVYKELIHRMRENVNELKILICEVSKALHLINSHNIIHSDLKTENILLKLKRRGESGGPYIKSVKLIDFGSSFLFTNLKQFSMATPEYMPPEILNYILFQNKLEYNPEMLKKMDKYTNAWVIDIWSLGCIMLEIITGVPLWMSIPTRITNGDDRGTGTGDKRITGLFAVKGRVFNTIIKKQIEVVSNLEHYLSDSNYSGIKVDRKCCEILKRMLSLEPENRISPHQVLSELGVEFEPPKFPFY